MSARHIVSELAAGDYRLRVEAVGSGPYVRVGVVGPPPTPGRGRKRGQPVLDVLQVEQLVRDLTEWAEGHADTSRAELLADQLRRQSFDPREATLTDQALRAKADREGRPAWADHWQTPP